MQSKHPPPSSLVQGAVWFVSDPLHVLHCCNQEDDYHLSVHSLLGCSAFIRKITQLTVLGDTHGLFLTFPLLLEQLLRMCLQL